MDPTEYLFRRALIKQYYDEILRIFQTSDLVVRASPRIYRGKDFLRFVYFAVLLFHFRNRLILNKNCRLHCTLYKTSRPDLNSQSNAET